MTTPAPISLKALQTLRALDVLDTRKGPEFEAAVRIASAVCRKPIALVSLLDWDRQWFKANHGLEGVRETPRDVSFCAHAALGDDVLEIPDALADDRFRDNPLVTGAPFIRFYAGAPLAMANGAKVGALCVIDRESGRLDDHQRAVLKDLAVMVSCALQSRRVAPARPDDALADELDLSSRLDGSDPPTSR